MMKILTTSAVAALTISAAQAGSSFTYTDGVQEFTGYKVEVVNARGTVVLVHDWNGLTAHEMHRADELGKMGFNVLAVDLFGEDVSASEAERMFENAPLMQARLIAAVEESRSIGYGWGWGPEATFIAGYCAGGRSVVDLALTGWGEDANIQGFISFDGLPVEATLAAFEAPVAPMLIIQGGQDTRASALEVAQSVEQLEFIGADFQFAMIGGAQHGYGITDAANYDAVADLRSWHSAEDFLTSAIR